MGLFIGIIIVVFVAAVAGVVGFLGILFKSSLKAGKEASKSTSKLPPMCSEDSSKLIEARKSIISSRQIALRIKDDVLRQRAQGVLDQAEDVVSTVKCQPEEIRRARQYFSYYLPTLNAVYKKYVELESGGMETDKQKRKMESFLDDVSSAFTVLAKNMYKDDQLDFEVETETMRAVLKRDGLL